MIIFICGVPASGKSSFGKFLRDKFGYFYIDMEHSPWSDESIHEIWDLIFKEQGNEKRMDEFVKSLKAIGNKVVLDLGFIPNETYFWIISSLKNYGCKVIWFNCPYNIAKKRFINRVSSPPIEYFEKQMVRIKNNWENIISKIDPDIIEVVKKNGKDKTADDIYTEIFI